MDVNKTNEVKKSLCDIQLCLIIERHSYDQWMTPLYNLQLTCKSFKEQDDNMQEIKNVRMQDNTITVFTN